METLWPIPRNRSTHFMMEDHRRWMIERTFSRPRRRSGSPSRLSRVSVDTEPQNLRATCKSPCHSHSGRSEQRRERPLLADQRPPTLGAAGGSQPGPPESLRTSGYMAISDVKQPFGFWPPWPLAGREKNQWRHSDRSARPVTTSDECEPRG
jgi:hypothetical protein